MKKTAARSGVLLLVLGLALAASCKHSTSNHKPGQPEQPGKKALAEKIAEAEELHGRLAESADGTDIDNDCYWVISRWNLTTAIQTAQFVADNPDATRDEIELALNELIEAIDAMNEAKKLGSKGNVLRAGLNEYLDEAEELLKNLNPSDDHGDDIPPAPGKWWVTGERYTRLVNAVAQAKEIAADTGATSARMEEALDELIAAYHDADGTKLKGTNPDKDELADKILEAVEKMADIKVSHAGDGSEWKVNEQWVSADARDALTEALDTARLANEDDEATQNAVTAAFDALTTALDNFNPQPGISVADKDELNALIAQIDAALETVFESVDGSEIYTTEYWVLAQDKAVLGSYVPAARAIAEDAAAPQEDVDAKTAELQAAIDEFNAKKRPGLLIHGAVEYTFTGPADEVINLNGAGPLSWINNDELSITVNDDYVSYRWYVDVSLVLEDETEITLFARDYALGDHTVTLRVIKDEDGVLVPYTKTLTFTVE